MDIFEKSLDIWKKINDPISTLFEKRFIFDNEYVGQENNCLSSVPKSVILLDGALNQLHVIKQKNDETVHQVVLMTPQPLEKFTKMELSPSKLFIALIGANSVSLIDICSLNSWTQTCKKVKEIFTTKYKIIDVKWYPKMYDYLVILTEQSINIYHISAELKCSCIYQFNLHEDIDFHSNSFGIKEEYIACDFGSANTNVNDNRLFILKDSGEIFLLPEINIIKNPKFSPTKILFDPVAMDNYQDDFTSLIVLRGSIDILVFANSHGTVQHALFINNKICVYETIAMQTVNKSAMHLLADETAYPPRYFLIHSTGIQSCILPYAVRLRYSLKLNSENDIEDCLNHSENTIFDQVLKTNLSNINQSQVRFGGITVIRRPSLSPELFVFQYREKKLLVNFNLRQESSLILNEKYITTNNNVISTNRESCRENSECKFLEAFRVAIGNSRRLPILACGMDGKDSLEKDKLSLVLQMNEIVGDYSTGLAVAGRLFEQRLGQITSVVKLQKDQLNMIRTTVEELKKREIKILTRYERATSRQQSLLKRLSECSHRIAEINGVSTRADKEAINTIISVHKRLDSTKTSLRSCQLRFSEMENFINEFNKGDSSALPTPVTDMYQTVLRQSDCDINRLIEDIRNLMKR